MVAAENTIYKNLSVVKSVHIFHVLTLPRLHIVVDDCHDEDRRMPMDLCGLLVETL